jgi:hypothetical protein
MSEILFPVSELPLLSARTTKYVEALIREGDSFDYNEWLKRVREEEARAKQTGVANTSRGLVAAEINEPMSLITSADQHAGPKSALPLVLKTIQVPRALRRPPPQAKSQASKARLRRWLEKVRRAWGEFQASRTRDAVYGYLGAVFAIVEHYRVRRKTKRLLRHAFEFANLPFDKNVDPFTAVIRCTNGRPTDRKTISKWARALRYVRYCKPAKQSLKKFMTAAGGVNSCADRYAKQFGRSGR